MIFVDPEIPDIGKRILLSVDASRGDGWHQLTYIQRFSGKSHCRENALMLWCVAHRADSLAGAVGGGADNALRARQMTKAVVPPTENAIAAVRR